MKYEIREEDNKNTLYYVRRMQKKISKPDNTIRNTFVILYFNIRIFRIGLLINMQTHKKKKYINLL